MRPEELQAKILTIAEYLESGEKPSRSMTAAAVRTVLSELTRTARVSGKVTKFVDKDFQTAVQGLEQLIQRLSKAAQTLNPQDEARESLEASVNEFKALRSALAENFDSLQNVDI